jgi:hypothetical protein
MNYQKIYDTLIARAIGRKKMNKHDPGYVYYERHHIVPKCLGGTDSTLNLVYLTAEEHWIAHLLLVKLNPENNKLVYACQAMSMSGGNNKRTTNKLFGWIRRKYSNATSERQKGRVVTQEQRLKISSSLIGRPALHQQGNNNISKRPEVAKKISESNKGRKQNFSNPELRLKRISEAKKGKPHLSGESNPAFKGWIIGTPVEGGPEIRISSKKDMDFYGFTKTSVYKCVNGINHQHKGYKFRREE